MSGSVYFFFLSLFFLPVTDCMGEGAVSPLKSSKISIWFGVNTFYLGGVSLIQYYVFLFFFLFDFQATPLELIWIWSHRIPLYVSYTRNKIKNMMQASHWWVCVGDARGVDTNFSFVELSGVDWNLSCEFIWECCYVILHDLHWGLFVCQEIFKNKRPVEGSAIGQRFNF